MTQSPPVPTTEDRRRADDEIIESIGAYEFGWHDNDDYSRDIPTGINEDVVRQISARKHEPEWMLARRLKALEIFERKPMPTWGPDLSGIDFDAFKYYVSPTDHQVKDWQDLPSDIRETYDRLGIPEAEKNRLVAGVAAQYESEVVYQQIQEDLERQGVVFLDTATGATIVVTAIVLLGLSWLIGPWVRRSGRFIPYIEDHGGHPHEPAEAASVDVHPHVHGRTIQHGDHLDFVHDGHRHALHGDHYDEH